MADNYFPGAQDGSTTGGINPPALTPGLKPRCTAIKDAGQAWRVIRTLEMARRESNLKNARIMAKYNSEKPYNQTALESEGLGWKSNFTTKPLPMLVDKVAPRFVKLVDGVKYLTNSEMPSDVPGASEKTEAFRREVTETVRGHPGWADLVSDLAMENALFGYTALAWLDEFSWWPKHFRQDSFFVPSGTKQLANSAQVVALRESLLVHELFDLISDKEAAEAAGWDVENTVLAINSAMPESRRSKDTSWERVYEDLIRESNVGLSHEAGPLVVLIWHLLATEINGKVSHYILVDSGTGEEKSNLTDYSSSALFEREARFETMSTALSFFSFQHGNGKLHGSKGIGREIYGLAAMVDRARNEMVDRMNLSGKILVTGDPKAIRKFKMNVVGNVLLIDQNFTISQNKIEAAVEPFLLLDQFLTQQLDQMAGATTPKAFEGERVTKAAVDLFASREEEARDNVSGRFLSQFATMMTTLQKRLCSPDTSEKDAKAMQERLLKVMTREELDKISSQPVAKTVKDFTEIERQQIVLFASENRGNPFYNQRELERRKTAALFGDDFADQVMLPEGDPTETAEQTRLQQMEMLILVGQAAEVPVSPRDNHFVHLEVMAPAMEKAAEEAVTAGPQGLEVLQALLAHAEAHFAVASEAGLEPEKLKTTGEFLNKVRAAVNKMNELEANPPPEAIPEGVQPPV